MFVRTVGYNRIYTTFGKLDSNESGQLDFAEWEKGAKVLGHELELKCTGSREEFDEIHQMRKGGGKSAKKGAGEGESAAYADTQVTFSDLCEWYQEKLTASATAEDEECGSNLGKHGTVLDSVWEVRLPTPNRDPWHFSTTIVRVRFAESADH